MKGFNTDSNGVLCVGSLPVTLIAEKCSTPLYIYDEAIIKAHMEEFVSNFKGYGFETQVIYASKAFNCKAIIELCSQYGLGLDVVSDGELFTAIQAGFNLKNVYMHGNNKSDAELLMALKNGIGTIILDNLLEAQRLVELSNSQEHEPVKVMLRVNPGIDAHTHKYIKTAYVDSKFGISILRMDEIKAIVQTIRQAGQLEFTGFHSHIGSQIFDGNAFEEEVATMMKFIRDFQDETGFWIKALDLGGGFAAYYTEEDQPIPVDEICWRILSACRRENDALGLDVKEIMIEPGRSIVANAGIQLYTVGFTKETQNKKYIFVNGGMCDNIRPALYQAKYSADVANKMNEEKSETVTIAGKCCESGDLLAEEILLQPAKTGDLLAVYTTGAYGYSMSSNYNKIPTPGVVFVDGGHMRWVIKPQSLEQLIEREVSEDIL